MGETAAQVYTDPAQPGAPQVGDVAVVAVDGAPNSTFDGETHYVGRVAQVKASVTGRAHSWALRGVPMSVYAVRRPTEAELATWAIQASPEGAP